MPHMPDRRLAWPQRRHCFWLAVFLTGAAVYGSLLPLRYTPVGWQQAVALLKAVCATPIGIRSRADWAANILLAVPISYCWLATLTVDRRHGLQTIFAAVGVVVGCIALSAALEFAQIWFPPRVTSQDDIAAQGVGAVCGVVLWLAVGKQLTDWCRRATASRQPRERLQWVLELYFLGLLLYSLLPLDLTLRPSDLVHKYREGQVTLVPFAHWSLGVSALIKAVSRIATFIPVGMLGALWRRPLHQAANSFATGLFYGLLAVAGIETIGLFVLSYHTDTTHLLLGGLGIGMGVWAMRRWQHDPANVPWSTTSRKAGSTLFRWLLLFGLYAGFAGAVLCAPFDVMRDRAQIKARCERFLGTPFAQWWPIPDLRFALDTLFKLVLFAPLGMLAVLVARRFAPTRPLRWMVLVVLLAVIYCVGFAVELLQVLLPSHWPSIGDTLTYLAGAVIGALVTGWILAKR